MRTGTLLALVGAVVVLHALSTVDARSLRSDFRLGPLPNGGTNWVLLVAGSDGWENYRHQSDICHAYQIMHKNGIPDTNIVVMMYDDIAENIHNRKKGQIFNSLDGPDVYHDVPKDYTKSAVNPKNFLKVLSGQQPDGGTGKVIKSGPNDRVFVYFADHGAAGLLAFPSTLGIIEHFLYADDMMKTLKQMAANNQFYELVFYTEACESGSMFNNLLPNNIHIYATTAATPYESSYACTYDKELGVYLDDCYSINWMNDTDFADVRTETLQQQFVAVRTATNESTVCQYGDLSIASQPLGNYMAQNSFEHKHAAKGHGWEHHAQHHEAKLRKPRKGEWAPVSSRDVKLATLRRALTDERDPVIVEHLRSAIEQELESRNQADRSIRAAVAHATGLGSVATEQFVQRAHRSRRAAGAGVRISNDQCTSPSGEQINFACLREAVLAYEQSCGIMSDYALQNVRVLERLCSEVAETEVVVRAAAAAC